MDIMFSTIGLIIIACGLGIFMEDQKPQNLLLELKNGQIVKTSIFKNTKYYCPIYCESQHSHLGHFSNQNCEMAESCYHFVHPELPNMANIDNNRDNWTHGNYHLPGSEPDITHSSLEKTVE